MTLGLLIADTLPDKRAARYAVESTLRRLPVDDCLVLSDECFIEGARHVRIAPLAGLAGYNALMLDALADHLQSDAYIVVQWDGFVVDEREWDAAFLQYDYIGAPWMHLGGIVGAGGFSLRSRRLADAVRSVRAGRVQRDVDIAEDVQICMTYRKALSAAGMRFPPLDVANRFAFERVMHADAGRPRTLGFHGAFNFPLVIAEDDILAMLGSIVSRMPRSWPAWHLFVLHAWLRGYESVGCALMEALSARDARCWARVAQACLSRGVSARWLEAAA